MDGHKSIPRDRPISFKLALASCVLSFAACSGGDASQTQTPEPVVQNQSPIANDDSLAVRSAVDATAIDVLENDNDPDGDPLNVTILSISEGTATVNSDNTVRFEPERTLFVGDVTIEYVVSDGAANDTATLTLTISGFDARLNWLPPTQWQNGTAIALSDLSGFEISYRAENTQQYYYSFVAQSDAVSYTLSGLAGAKYQFRMATRSVDGTQGRFSDPVTVQVGY